MKAALAVLIYTLSSLLAGCGDSVLIRTTPPGAKAYVDNNMIGLTPIDFRVPRSEITQHSLRVEKEGYEPIDDTIRSRFAVGRAFGAFFTVGIMYIFRSPMYLVPLPMYSLSPSPPTGQAADSDRALGEALRRAQALHDQGMLSDDELKRRQEEILKSNH